MLDAILGTPDNIGHWIDELLAYSASHAPMPRSKREKPSVSPTDLGERLEPLVDARAKALLRKALGDVDGASDLLERLAEAIRGMDESARPGTDRTARSAGTTSGKGRRPRSPSK